MKNKRYAEKREICQDEPAECCMYGWIKWFASTIPRAQGSSKSDRLVCLCFALIKSSFGLFDKKKHFDQTSFDWINDHLIFTVISLRLWIYSIAFHLLKLEKHQIIPQEMIGDEQISMYFSDFLAVISKTDCVEDFLPKRMKRECKFPAKSKCFEKYGWRREQTEYLNQYW